MHLMYSGSLPQIVFFSPCSSSVPIVHQNGIQTKGFSVDKMLGRDNLNESHWYENGELFPNMNIHILQKFQEQKNNKMKRATLIIWQLLLWCFCECFGHTVHYLQWLYINKNVVGCTEKYIYVL